MERPWRAHGQPKRQGRSGVTSRPPQVGTPDRLLELKRGHWRIQNRRHRATAVPVGEAASLVQRGPGPTVIARLRHAARSRLHRAGVGAITARRRHLSQHPHQAGALVCHPPPPHA